MLDDQENSKVYKQQMCAIVKIAEDALREKNREIEEKEILITTKEIDLQRQQIEIDFLSDLAKSLKNENEIYKKEMEAEEDLINKTYNEGVNTLINYINYKSDKIEKVRKEYTQSSNEILSNWLNSWKN